MGSYAGGNDLATVHRRRTEELRLIGKYDSATINPRRECWFLVETSWLEGWAKFVRGEGPPPDSISNKKLFEGDLKTPVKDLKPKVDYRGVNPMVWFLYNEMYGKDECPEVCRYVIDLYELEVPAKYKAEIEAGPRRKAKLEVQKMRWRVEPPDIARQEQEVLCGCVTESMLDCVFINLFTCCFRCRCFRCLPCCRKSSGPRYTRVNYADADADGDDEMLQDDAELDEQEQELERELEMV